MIIVLLFINNNYSTFLCYYDNKSSCMHDGKNVSHHVLRLWYYSLLLFSSLFSHFATRTYLLIKKCWCLYHAVEVVYYLDHKCHLIFLNTAYYALYAKLYWCYRRNTINLTAWECDTKQMRRKPYGTKWRNLFGTEILLLYYYNHCWIIDITFFINNYNTSDTHSSASFNCKLHLKQKNEHTN